MKPDLKATSYSTVGLEMVLSVVLPYLLGSWLDSKLGTEPYLGVVLLLFGLATAVRTLYRAVKRMQRETEQDGFEACQTGRSARFALEQRGELRGEPAPSAAPRRKKSRRRSAKKQRRPGRGRPGDAAR